MTVHGAVEICDHCGILDSLVPLLDGKRSAISIYDNFAISDKTAVEVILQELAKLGVILDRKACYKHFHWLSGGHAQTFICEASHANSANPESAIAMCVEEHALGSLLALRKSNRHFGSSSITEKELFHLCHAMYGHNTPLDNLVTRPVGSAGGIYSLTLFVFLPVDIGRCKQGLYRWSMTDNALYHQRARTVSLIDVNRTLFNEPYLCSSAILLVLTANISLVSRKYGNKSYKFVFTEAGHVMQNAHLFCAQQSLGMVQIGGFDEQSLLNFVQRNNTEMIAGVAVAGSLPG